ARADITYIVLSNASFGWIKASQKDDKGGRYHNVDFDRVDQAAVAAAYGVTSWRVDDPADLELTLTRALAHNGPSLVDVITQPLEEAHAPVRRWMG
ncbi:MAG: thiamine pyrophosphate-dependent enzyme, partial [Pseudomonadota bacterium]